MCDMRYTRLCASMLGVLAMLCTLQAHAYESGSTGADGALLPIEDTVVELPTDGVLNYTRISIPSGVIVSFKKEREEYPGAVAGKW